MRAKITGMGSLDLAAGDIIIPLPLQRLYLCLGQYDAPNMKSINGRIYLIRGAVAFSALPNDSNAPRCMGEISKNKR